MDDFTINVDLYWLQRPFTSTNTIVIGVSGGVDSMALLHYICQNNKHPAEKIVVVCVNHQLRPEAQAETELVVETAGRWGVRTIVKSIDTEQLGKLEKRSLEDAAREARYRVFHEVCEQTQASAVLTAHHADDQVETVVMNLLRGSGGSGLRGMRPVSERAILTEKMTVFRPLLGVWRDDILAYAQKHQIPFMEDSSNQNTLFLRNRVRHELIPTLITYNTQAKEHIWQTAALLQDEHDGWQQFIATKWDAAVIEGASFVQVKLADWQTFHVSVQRALLRQMIKNLANLQGVTFEHIEQARTVILAGQHGTEWHLPNQLRLRVVYDTAVLTSHLTDVTQLYDWPMLEEAQTHTLFVPGQVTLLNGWQVSACLVEKSQLLTSGEPMNRWEALLGLNLGDELFIRPRVAGERFQPLGMAGRIKVKDVMINEKMPAAVRNRWPIVADSEGVLWLTGYRIAQRAAVNTNSKFVVHIQVHKVGDA